MNHAFLENHSYSVGRTLLTELIKKTTQEELSWVSFGALLKYLSDEDISVKAVPPIHNYVIFHQRQFTIPDLSNNTYLAIFKERVFVLSQGLYSSKLDLDFLDLTSSRRKWRTLNVSPVLLVRLRDAIRIAGVLDSTDSCQNILYAIRGIFV